MLVYSIIGVVVCFVPYILFVWGIVAQQAENPLLAGHGVFVWLWVLRNIYLSFRMYSPRYPTKRRLNFSPYAATPKKARFATPAGAQGGTARYRKFNTRVTRGPTTRGSIITQLKSLQRAVKRLSPEVKYKDFDTSATNVPTTGTVVHISGIDQGDTMLTRTGNQIVINKINLSGFWQRNVTDFGGDAFTRFAIVVDKEQVNATAPTAANIFETPSNPTQALPLLSNLERFRILYMSPVYDMWMMRLDSDNLAASTPTQKTAFAYTWTGNLRVLFSGTAQEVQKNGVYVVWLSNVATADVTSTCRVGFTDV